VGWFLDGSYIVSASDNGIVYICNAVTGKTEVAIDGLSGMNSVEFLSDGGCVVSASMKETIYIWGAATVVSEAMIEEDSEATNVITPPPNSSCVVSIP
jgi:WD40 repeat protein